MRLLGPQEGILRLQRDAVVGSWKLEEQVYGCIERGRSLPMPDLKSGSNFSLNRNRSPCTLYAFSDFHFLTIEFKN